MSTDTVDMALLFQRAHQIIDADPEVAAAVVNAFLRDHVVRFDFSGADGSGKGYRLSTCARSRFTTSQLREVPKPERPGDVPGWLMVSVGARGKFASLSFRDRKNIPHGTA